MAWRYTVLRLHEVVQEIVPHLDERDGERFRQGLARVFIDNYAAIPPQSIRRLLALREAGIISVAALGDDYTLDVGSDRTVITTKRPSIVLTYLLTLADKSRSKRKICPSRRCENSWKRPAMRYPISARITR